MHKLVYSIDICLANSWNTVLKVEFVSKIATMFKMKILVYRMRFSFSNSIHAVDPSVT